MHPKHTHSVIQSIEKYLQLSSTTSLAYSSSYRLFSEQISLPLLSHRLMRKLERKWEGGKPRRNITSRSELGWLTIVSTNSVSAVRIPRLDKRNGFLWYTFQLQAVLQNCTIDWIKRYFKIKKTPNAGLQNAWLRSKICYRVKIRSMHLWSGRKPACFWRIYFLWVLDNPWRIISVCSLNVLLTHLMDCLSYRHDW